MHFLIMFSTLVALAVALGVIGAMLFGHAGRIASALMPPVFYEPCVGVDFFPAVQLHHVPSTRVKVLLPLAA